MKKSLRFAKNTTGRAYYINLINCVYKYTLMPSLDVSQQTMIFRFGSVVRKVQPIG